MLPPDSETNSSNSSSSNSSSSKSIPNLKDLKKFDDEVGGGIKLISDTNDVICYKMPDNIEVVKQPDSDGIMCFKRHATKNINTNKK